MKAILKLNELCVLAWQNCDSKHEWFLAYVKGFDADKYTGGHLNLANNYNNNQLLIANGSEYPSIDVQEAELDQITNCNVKGNWDIAPDK